MIRAFRHKRLEDFLAHGGKAGISADMAVRLAAALGGSAESWLHMQADYELWPAEKALKRQVAKIEPLKAVA